MSRDRKDSFVFALFAVFGVNVHGWNNEAEEIEKME